MKVNVTKEVFHKTDVVILGAYDGEKLSKELTLVDKELHGAMSTLTKSKKNALDYGAMHSLYTYGHLEPRCVVVVGLGKKSDITLEKLRRISAKSVKYARDLGFTHVSSALALSLDGSTTAVSDGILLGLYKFNKYLTVDVDKIKNVEKVTVVTGDKAAVKKAVTVCDNVNYVRDLVNEPAEVVTPQYLAAQAKMIAKQNSKMSVKVFGKSEIVKMGMGGLEGVSRGGGHDPQFIVLDYKGGSGKPIIFVGKGITFDAGGLDVKPAAYMEDMRIDMGGAATVLGALKAVSELGLKKRVIGIVPTCENMLGPRAFKQGDILKSYNGKTIEIWHTDAEGRLILADALGYAEKNFKGAAIIDIATLTGASVIALGHEVVSMMSTNDELKKKYLAAASAVDEATWELPLHDDYKELVRGDIGDVRNTAKESPGPGTITAGLFLSNFVEDTPWLHLDIGATVFLNKEKAYKGKGATGVCLRTFVKLVEDF